MIAIDSERCRIEVDADSMDWAVFAVGMSGGRLLGASPPEFVEYLENWSNRLVTAVEHSE